jgi:membrane protein involved in colicin uptake
MDKYKDTTRGQVQDKKQAKKAQVKKAEKGKNAAKKAEKGKQQAKKAQVKKARVKKAEKGKKQAKKAEKRKNSMKAMKKRGEFLDDLGSMRSWAWETPPEPDGAQYCSYCAQYRPDIGIVQCTACGDTN